MGQPGSRNPSPERAAAPFEADFGRAADDYACHRQGFPESFFDSIARFGLRGPGQRVLDLATGTGQMARGLARRGARVTGLDRAPELLLQARALDRDAGVSVDYQVGLAEETGLGAAAFDWVTAAQCWHWFDAPRAAREIARLLKPQGRILIAHLDWLPAPGTVVEATEALILEFNPSWPYGGLDGLPTHALRDLERAGFHSLELLAYDLPLVYTHQAWRGRIRASAGVAASLPPEAVERFDGRHAQLLRERFPADPLSVPHRIFAAALTRG